MKRKLNLICDYFFCFNKKFNVSKILMAIDYIKSSEYALQGFNQPQKEMGKFFTGLFINSIFKIIIELQKKR